MVIEVLKETTPELLPHTYYVNKKSGKLIAFQPVDGELKVYDIPKSFSKRYRKFEKIDEIDEL